MNQKLKNSYLEIGTIVNTHGIKGEVRILSGTTNPEETFSINKIIYFEKNDEINSLTIKTSRQHKKFTLVTFEGVNDINDIEWIKNTLIYVERNLEDDEYYLIDMVGKNVIDQNDKLIGIVSEIFDQGPYDSLIIKLKNGNSTNIPIVDEFKVKFNKGDDFVTVNIPKEFLD